MYKMGVRGHESKSNFSFCNSLSFFLSCKKPEGPSSEIKESNVEVSPSSSLGPGDHLTFVELDQGQQLNLADSTGTSSSTSSAATYVLGGVGVAGVVVIGAIALRGHSKSEDVEPSFEPKTMRLYSHLR